VKKKRLLIGLTYYLPNISGLTLYAKNLADRLNKNGYELTVLTSNNGQQKGEEVIDGIRVVRISGFGLGKGFVMPGIITKSFELVRQNDVVNYHLPSIESVMAALWCKILGKKFVVTYHCSFDSGSWVLNKIIGIIESISCALADKIVVNSIDYLNGYKLLENFRDKVVEIYPPIEKGKVKMEKKNEEKVIGFLGRLSKEKNLEVLFEAIPYLKNEYGLNFKILLAGSRKALGEEEYGRKIENLVEANGDVVKDLGKVEKIEDFYSRIDCLVLPSNNRLESFGMVSAEAINVGVPVVVSNTPGARVPVVVSKAGLLFDPKSAKDLAKKIIEVLENKNKYKAGREMFEISDTIMKYEQILG